MYLVDMLSSIAFAPAILQLTRKSTPIVADASSSGNHCSSEKRKRRLLFPTDELPMSNSLTLIVSVMAVVVAGS
jgi:hypothetical protein